MSGPKGRLVTPNRCRPACSRTVHGAAPGFDAMRAQGCPYGRFDRMSREHAAIKRPSSLLMYEIRCLDDTEAMLTASLKRKVVVVW